MSPSRLHETPGVLVLGSDFKALGAIRSFARRGIPTVVVDNTPRSAWYSRFPLARHKWDGPMEGEDFLAFLLAVGRADGLRGWIVLPCQDEVVELVARFREQLETFYRTATPGYEVVRWATDKRLTHRLAEEAGVAYPRTWYPSDTDQLAALDVRYPVIVKPAISVHLQYALRLKALPATTPEELRSQYDLARGIVPADELMIQELIPGGGERQYSIGAYCQAGRMVMAMTARRLRQYPIDFGLGSSYVRAEEVPELLPLGERLVARMGVTGMLEIEFKYDARDQQYKLLDINLRPWGWHSLCAACGLDFPYIQYRDLVGLPIEPAAPTYDAHWLRALTDLPAGWQELRAGLTTPTAYARSLLGKTVFSVFDWRDPLPVLGDLASAAWRAGLHAAGLAANPRGAGPKPGPTRSREMAAVSAPDARREG